MIKVILTSKLPASRSRGSRSSGASPLSADQARDAKGAVYYGPYVSAGLIREALTIIRRIFHFRACDPFPREACLDYHIGLCDAPCIGNITRKDYARNIRNVRLILDGEKDVLYKNLKVEMEGMSRKHEFEQAARIRDQIRAIGALYSGTRDINYFKEVEQLRRALNLPRLPERVETFDISNIMGNQAVGSMVSFFNGKPDKSNYRRFRIREVEGIDDFQMLAEVIRRRYSRLKRERLIFPDLIIVDGGKGQLSAAVAALTSLEVQIPIIAIAKREEEVFCPAKGIPCDCRRIPWLCNLCNACAMKRTVSRFPIIGSYAPKNVWKGHQATRHPVAKLIFLPYDLVTW